jgi:tRNA(Ile)-lysidine synthetase-like protein
MNITKNIKHFITTHALIERNAVIIVGLSGGPDSVFLLHFLASLQQEYNLTLIAAHLNHEWRTEAHQEQLDCQAIAAKLNITFVTAKISELTPLPFKLNGSKEEYARKVRRYFFEKTAREHNAHSIALAHHLQDQEETFFIRLIRGSSLTGLTAIKQRNGLYIRPLLETNKTDILDWLHTYNIPYAIDASNESQDYLRNRIRSTVLPALHECDNRFEANFMTTLQRLTATELFLEKLTARTFAEISSKDDGIYTIDTAALFNLDPIVQNRLILHWLIKENVPFPITQAFLDEIIRFLSNPRGGTHTIHEQWKIVKKQKKASLIKI